jgi:hypothetical protein
MGTCYNSIQRLFQRKSGRWRTDLEKTSVLVLAIPNSWGESHHMLLREACIFGAILPEEYDDDRLQFATEGEASTHYPLHHSESSRWLKPGVPFVVTGAGESTVDSPLCMCAKTKPKLKPEELRVSECAQAGSVYVGRAPEEYLGEMLAGSKFRRKEIIHEFEWEIKRLFDGTYTTYMIEFGKKQTNRKNRHFARSF